MSSLQTSSVDWTCTCTLACMCACKHRLNSAKYMLTCAANYFSQQARKDSFLNNVVQIKYKCMQSLKMNKTLFLIVVHVSLTSTARQFNVLSEQARSPPTLSPYVPSSGSFLLLQTRQQPRGPHYKQQIKGLPLIRCQGQRRALPVLAMIQYLLICCAPAWKEISPLTGK